MNDIADRLKYILEVNGLTYSQFAERIGVASSAISHFVNRRNKPSLDAITGILTAFPDISPDWLLMGVGAPNRGENDKPEDSKPPFNVDFAQTSAGGEPMPGELHASARPMAIDPAAHESKELRALGAASLAEARAPRASRREEKDTSCGQAFRDVAPAEPTKAIVPIQIMALYSDGTFACYSRRENCNDAIRQTGGE